MLLPSDVWSDLAVLVPAKGAVQSWFEKRASEVQNLKLHTDDTWYIDRPAWYEDAKDVLPDLQMQHLLETLDSAANLTGLTLALDGYCAASKSGLATLCPQLMELSGLQSLTLIDSGSSVKIADSLADLAKLTKLTSLWLQRGQRSPHGGHPSTGLTLCFDIGDFDYLVGKLDLQGLTLIAVRFDSNLEMFWREISALRLRHLWLDYISFDSFDHWKKHWPIERDQPVPLPSVVSVLVELRYCVTVTPAQLVPYDGW